MTQARWLTGSILSVFLRLQTAHAEPEILMSVERLDDDGDGIISADEFEAAALARWASDDLDQDGKVTRAELETKSAAQRQQRFSERDRNGDAELDRGELQHMSESLFTRLDSDHSGTLTQSELDAASPLTAMAGAGRIDTRAMLTDDLDRDGVITRAEALAAARMLMLHLDADGDGVLRVDELAQRHQLLGGGPFVLAR
jgi:Ca2+-binding EF-hand superfamily protein